MYQKLSMGGYDEYDLPPGIAGNRYQPNNDNEPISDIFRLFGVTATYELGFAQLTSASAWSRASWSLACSIAIDT